MICWIVLILCNSCTDDTFYKDNSSHYIYIDVDLRTPLSQTRALSESDEYLIKDLTVLLFDEDQELITTSSDLAITVTEPGDIRKIKIALDRATYQNSTVSFVMLANLADNLDANSLDLSAGRTKNQIFGDLRCLVDGAWAVEAGKVRSFPMYGTIDAPLDGYDVYKTVYMLRAVSRIQFFVNNGSGLSDGSSNELFNINSIHVYGSRKGGYIAPLVPFTNEMLAVTLPSSPEDFDQRTRSESIVYDVAESEKHAFLRTIYIPESNHLNSIDEPVIMVVGGFYNGSGNETFYRVDFEEGGNAYDALRNYTYDFNIKAVTAPGKPTPEEALDSDTTLDIEIKAWSETKIADTDLSIYELKVSKSVFVLPSDHITEYSDVSTTYYTGEWTIDNPNHWFTVNKNSAGDGIEIHVGLNGTNALRAGTFTITTGKLVKNVYVSQLPEKTANCYISSEPGLQGLKATVMGNGEYGTTINGTNIASYLGNPNYNSDGSINKDAIKSARLIWQSRPGLVTSVGGDVANGETLLNEYDILPYTVGDPLPGELGGNAVIGIYDEDDNVLWSWHIWVVWGWEPEDNLLHFLTTGVRSGYYFMDKNLGALNNEVSDANAYGLLYQWGRKDPMRGAANFGSDNVYPTYGFTGAAVDYLADNSTNWHAVSTSFSDILRSVRLPMSYSTTWGGGAHSSSEALWGNPLGGSTVPESAKNDPSKVYYEGQKSIYDPCPPGYKVPSINGFYFGTSDDHATCANSHPTNGKAGIGDNGYCDIISNGYYIYYFGRYKGYEKYHTWMPMAPYYNGTTTLTSTDGKEDYAFTWLNAGKSGSDAYPVGWHPVNNHIHKYASFTTDKKFGGTVRCVKETDPDLVSFTAPEKIVLQNPAGSDFMFEILTNMNWYIERNNLEYDWFTAVKGDDNKSITVTAKTANESIYDRIGYVTIVFSNGEKAIVQIIQNPVPKNISGNISLTYVQGNENSTTFTAPFARMAFEIVPGSYPIWFTPTITQTGTTVRISAISTSVNYFNTRQDKVTLKLKGEDYTWNIPVEQAGFNIKLNPASTDVELGYANGSSKTITFTLPNNATSCVISGEGHDWMTPVLTKNGANYTLTITAKSTNYIQGRHSHVTITIGDGTANGYDLVFEVGQLAYNVDGGKIALGFANASTNTHVFTLPAESSSYALVPGAYPDWLDQPTFSRNKAVLTITAKAKSTCYGASRTGYIKVLIDGVYEVEIEVTQAPYTNTGGKITLAYANGSSNTYLFDLPAASSSYQIKGGYPDWLKPPTFSLKNKTLTVTAESNSICYAAPRTGIITVIIDNVYEVDIEVTQNAYTVASGQITLAGTNNVSANYQFAFPSSGTNREVINYPSWINEPILTYNNPNLRVTATSNSICYDTSRTGIITVRIDEVYDAKIEVIQNSIIAKKSIELANKSGEKDNFTIPNSIPSGINWAITVDDEISSFIKVNKLPTGTTNGSNVTPEIITTEKNGTGVARSGYVYVTFTDSSNTVLGVTAILVTQKK